jgi:hypothetical protein
MLFRKVASVGLVGGWLGLAALVSAQETRLADDYGLLSPEIYKLDPRVDNLRLGDLDGDGVSDVIVANNARSRIELFLSRKSADDAAGPAATEANQVGSDRRLRRVSIPVNREIVSLQVAELTGDKLLDLVFAGNPADIQVLPNLGEGRFGDPIRVTAGEGIPSSSALAAGDLDRDGKADLVLLGPDEITFARQRTGGGLDEPRRLPHTASSPSLVLIADLDGDGSNDLIILDGTGDEPVRVRSGSADGQLGPEERLALDEPRAVSLANVDGKPGAEVLSIEAKSGRARVLTLESDDARIVKGDQLAAGAAPRGRLRVYPLPRQNARGRTLAVADLDGDRKQDVIVADPAGAQVFVFRQGPSGLTSYRAYPTLAGVKAIRAGDLDGDGKAEVLVLSGAEKEAGLSRWADDRLGPPVSIPSVAEPVSLDLGDLDRDGKPEVLYAVVSAEKPASRQAFDIHALRLGPDGKLVPFLWGEKAAFIRVADLNAAPTALRVVDLDGDPHPDLLVFDEYSKPIVLRGRAKDVPEALAAGAGPLTAATPVSVAAAGPLGAGLLVAQNGYARVVSLDDAGRWSIRDQFNAARTDAQVVSAVALGGLGGDDVRGKPAVALYDRRAKALSWARSGGERPGEPLPIGAIDDQGLHVADLDGDGRDDLLIAGTDRFAVVLTGQDSPKLTSLAAYETTREDARFGDLMAGDANGDGQPDLIISDTGEHFIEFVAVQAGPPLKLARALAFQVYERKAFRDPDRNVEPREMALGDTDGDHRDDLVLLVHDRVLVYRQDPGPTSLDASVKK